MKLTITVEDGTVALEPRLSATHGGMAFGEPTESDKAAEIEFRLPAVPWRDRRDAWNKAFEKGSAR